MATIFFVIFAYITYGWRKRSRTAFLLSLAIGYLALCYLKDSIFLFPVFSENLFVENLSSLFDVACTPFICAFFLEVSRPGMFSNRDLVLLYLLFAAIIILYWIFPTGKVMLGAYILAPIVALYTMVIVPFNVARYNRLLAENVSYKKM